MKGWAHVPVGTYVAYETVIGQRRAIRSWARREPDDANGNRQLIHWQEVDLHALNRPGGRVRAVTRLTLCASLAPRDVAILTAAGTASLRFTRRGVTVRLVDGTSLRQPEGGVDLPLLDNAPALLAIMLRVLAAQDRLPGRFAAYLPGTLGRIEYALEPAQEGWCSSLGEGIAVAADGWMSSVAVGPDIRIVRRDAPPLRWRTLAPGKSAITHAQGWEPARDVTIRHAGRRHVGRFGRVHRPRAALLWIGGSGTHDRNGRAGGIDLGYGDIAARLAQSGIACLLYDKPGAGRTPADPELDRPDFERTIALAAAWLDWLSARRARGVPLFVAGHSLGGQVAAWLAAQRGDLAGLCLLATAARTIDAVLAGQVTAEGGDLDLDPAATATRLEDLGIFFEWLRAGRKHDLPERLLALEPYADWYDGLLRTSPSTCLPSVKVPVAIAQGGLDIQVPPDDAAALAAMIGHSDVSVRRFPTLDHLFKPSRTGVTNIKAYGDRRRHVARAMTDWLARWITDRAAPDEPQD